MRRFCAHCGTVMQTRVPDGDDRPRDVCPKCGFVHYLNPKMVVGSVVEWEDRVLLCRRSIEPRYGLWTIPAGYLELGETAAEGAKREAREEACAEIDIIAPYMLLNLTFVGQIYLLFRARLIDGVFAAGEESLEARLVAEDEIPWREIAFTSVEKTLKQFFIDRAAGAFPFHMDDVSR